MFEEKLRDLVLAHYADANPPVLLLSALGQRITEAAIQPEAGDRRSLREIIGTIQELTLVQDPEATAFIAVVPKGEEVRAEQLIVERRRCRFLKGLARPILLAFTIETAVDQIVSVEFEPRIRFQVGGAPEEGWVAIESDLRLPGLPVDDIDALGGDATAQFEANIRAWCDRHGLDPASLARKRRTPQPTAGPRSEAGAPNGRATSALERLLEAQEPSLAKRFIVPIDIALVLSRMP